MALDKEHLANLHINNQTMFKAFQQPCSDCLRYWHPLVLTFDHVDRSGKYKSPSDLRTYAPAVFNEEIAKCEVVCMNCHAMREYLRDLKLMAATQGKIKKYKYYQRLIPYLTNGASINKLAFTMVPIGIV